MKRGKKYLESAKLVDRSKLYDPTEALDLVQQISKANFDETIEVSVRLGRSRHADQQVREPLFYLMEQAGPLRYWSLPKVKRPGKPKRPVLTL